jgi:hypothetical protein
MMLMIFNVLSYYLVLLYDIIIRFFHVLYIKIGLEIQSDRIGGSVIRYNGVQWRTSCLTMKPNPNM